MRQRPLAVSQAGLSWAFCAFVLSTYLGGLATPVLAKDDASPKPLLWGKQCTKGQGGKTETCAVQQFVTGQPGERRLLVVQFAYDGPQNKPQLILSAPLGGLLPGGVTLRIDDQKPLRVPFETCNTGGCFAIIDMDTSALEQFRKGKVLTVRYLLGDKKLLDLPVKLDGLDAALKSIAP